jgi:hypothetical protein
VRKYGNRSVPRGLAGTPRDSGTRVTKDCLVAIGATAKDGELLPDQVSFFNRLQIAVSFRYIYYHPASC